MFGKRQLEFFCKGGVKVKYLAEEVISALQKEIRRGSQNALYWAQVLSDNGYANAAFNRLKVITLEDAAVRVRLACDVERCFQEFETERKKANASLTETMDLPQCRQALLKATQILVSAPKTRSLNHALALARKALTEEMGCEKGGEMGGYTGDDTDEKKHVIDANGALEDFKVKLATKAFEPTLVAALRVQIWDDSVCKVGMWSRIKSEGKFDPLLTTLNRWTKYNESLCIAQALVALTHDANHLLSGFDVKTVVEDIVVGEIPDGPLDIPDYAIDKHTARGKKMGRGVEHFYTVGAQVNNEPWPDPWVDLSKVWYMEIESKQVATLSSKTKAKSKAIMADILKTWKSALGIQDTEKSTKKSAKKTKRKAEKQEDEKDEKEEKEDRQKEEQSIIDPSCTDSPPKKKKKTYAIPDNLRVEGFPGQLIEEVNVDPFSRLEGALLTQIPCGWKPPAMIGVWKMENDMWYSNRVFLKGPESRERALTQQWFNCVKAKLRDIRAIVTRVIEYNSQFYILMEDISYRVSTQAAKKRDQDIVIVKSGEGFDHSKNMQEFLRLEKQWMFIRDSMVKEYLAILMMRQLLGSSDTCNRNILQRGETIWSVDECVSGKPLGVVKRTDKVAQKAEFWIAHCNKKLNTQLEEWFFMYRDWCRELVASWRAVDLSAFCRYNINERFDAILAHIE